MAVTELRERLEKDADALSQIDPHTAMCTLRSISDAIPQVAVELKSVLDLCAQNYSPLSYARAYAPDTFVRVSSDRAHKGTWLVAVDSHALAGLDACTHAALHSAVAILNLPIAAKREHAPFDNVELVRLLFVCGKVVHMVAEVDATGDKKPQPVSRIDAHQPPRTNVQVKVDEVLKTMRSFHSTEKASPTHWREVITFALKQKVHYDVMVFIDDGLIDCAVKVRAVEIAIAVLLCSG